MNAPQAVTIVQSRRVAAGRAHAFEGAVQALLEAAADAPGRLSAEVLRGPVRGASRDYHLVYRFDSDESLRRWEASPRRREATQAVERLAESGARRDLSGLEAFVDLPDGRAGAPPRARLALVTWLGIWPLVSLALWGLGPYLAGLPFLVRTGLTCALVVAVMAYAVGPALTRLFARWLTPTPG